VWEIADASQHSADVYNVGFNAEYEPVEVNPKKFESFIAEVVTLLSGDMPVTGEKCNNCEYFHKRSSLDL
jgi:hypothetical protein